MVGQATWRQPKLAHGPIPLELPPTVQQLFSVQGRELQPHWLPASGVAAELATVIGQHTGIRPKHIPHMDAAINMIINRYPRTSCGWKYRHTEARMQNILESLNRKATPGYPIRSYLANNGQVLEDPMIRDHVVKLAAWRLDQLATIDPAQLDAALSRDPLFAVRSGLADVTSVILKNEPHPARKVKTQRWRFVNAESLPDQIVEKQCFTGQDSAEIATWNTVPSKPGMGLTDDDARKLAQFAKRRGFNYLSDAHGWDNTVPAQLMDADIEMRIRLCTDPDPAWVRAIRNINTLSKRRVLMLSDGTLFVRVTPGGMASGRKVTSSSNSRMRALVGAVAGVRFGYTANGMYMGDDAFEFVPESVSPTDVETHLSETTGVKLTDARRATADDFEFCSQRFITRDGVTRVYPLNPDKTLLRMLATKGPTDNDQVRDNIEAYFRHLPERKLYMQAVDAIIAGRSAGPVKQTEESFTKHVEDAQPDFLVGRC